MSETYNGWTNWDTREAYNWLTSEESTYRMCRRSWNENQVRDIFITCYKKVSRVELGAVDWTEVFDAINEE